MGVLRGSKGETMPREPNHWEEPKSPNKVANTFFNTEHLLPKDLRFEYRGAKLVSCPGRHLTSVRPWISLSLPPPTEFSTLFMSSSDIFLFFSFLLSPVGWLQLESIALSYTVSIRQPDKESFLT